MRATLDEAAAGSREIVGDDAALDAAEGLARDGLDKLEADRRLMSATAISVEAKLWQRSTIRIRNQEGDLVKLELRQVARISASDIALGPNSESLAVTELAMSNRSRLVLRLKGDLNEAELGAIQGVFAYADELATRFFAGDTAAALEVAAGLEYDSEQLARVSMRFRSADQRIRRICNG